MTEPLSEAAKRGRRELRQTFERAHALFMDKLEVAPTPEHYPLPYDVCEDARAASWPYMSMANLMVSGDIEETINQLNAWCEWLVHLSCWIDVLPHFEEQEAWHVQFACVDPLLYTCLHQPSATRERFGHVATQAIHQANLNCMDAHRDELKQHKKRGLIEEQLAQIGKGWMGTPAFLDALAELDSENFRSASLDFRNKACHKIAPRFGFGFTNLVVRSTPSDSEQAFQLGIDQVAQSVPGRRRVSYNIGGTRPLDLREACALAQQEFAKSVAAFQTYESLLREMIAALRMRHQAGQA